MHGDPRVRRGAGPGRTATAGDARQRGRNRPAYRRAALAVAKERLDRDIEVAYRFPEDRALARIPDTQGLGGSRPSITDA
jgi:hypothetical protein